LFSLAAAFLLAACRGAAPVQVHIYSTWTTGPAAVALEQAGDQFHAGHPEAVIVNDALYPLSPARSDVTSFQTAVGVSLFQQSVRTGRAAPLDEVFREAGLDAVMPEGLRDLVYYQGHPYALPVDVHRANVLFYNAGVFNSSGIDADSLQTFEGWQKSAGELVAQGIIPLALGDRDPSAAALLFETVLVGTLGAEGYEGLWTGDTDWRGSGVARALNNFGMMLAYTNPGHSALTWDQANQLVIDGKAAMTITSDWADADYIAKGFDGYRWTSPPGNQGIFDAFSDAFSLSSAAEHPELGRAFLTLLASKPGQQALNEQQGALCARMDCDYGSFDPYLQSAAHDLKADKMVPSAVEGAAAPETWSTDFVAAVANFVQEGDLAVTQAALASACRAAGVCK
jgi:glucose/mannose transport system substrate-binding protein